MARPRKKGLDYFPFDTDFFTRPEIEALHARFGNDGVMIYLYILCEAYRRNGYYLVLSDDVMDHMMAHVTGNERVIKQVLKYLVSRSLLFKLTDSKLTGPVTIYTSPAIQKQFQEVSKRLKRHVRVDETIWMLKEDESESCIKCTLFSDKHGENCNNSVENEDNSGENTTKESKENEKKLNEMKEESAYVIGRLTKEDYMGLLSRHGSEIVRYYIARTLDYNTCDKSTIERWIKQDKARNKVNKFNDFPQREYDFDLLEKRLMENLH